MTIKKPTLILACHGGLGNRLLPLLSAMLIAIKLDYDIKYFWIRDNTCDCTLESIFKLKSINLDEIISLKPHIGFVDYNNNKKYQNELKKTENHKTIFNVKTDIDKMLALRENLLCENNTLLNSKHYSLNEIPKLFSLILKDDLKESIMKMSNDMKLFEYSNIVGCHLRCTDSPGYSPDKVNNILTKVKKLPNTMFFICSDDESQEKKFSSESNCLINKKSSYVKKLNPNKPFKRNYIRDSSSVIQATHDLCFLSLCECPSEFSTNPESSFIKTAKTIKNWHNF